MEIATVQLGDPLYEDLLGPVRRDAGLLATMLAEADSLLDEAPDTTWCIATARKGRNAVAAAWIACDREDGILRLRNHYEPPDYRHRGFYALLVRRVHETVVEPCGLPAYTYVFETPMLALTALGWTVADEGNGDEPDAPSHQWWRMEWTP